jgi:hypothetical protein
MFTPVETRSFYSGDALQDSPSGPEFRFCGKASTADQRPDIIMNRRKFSAMLTGIAATSMLPAASHAATAMANGNAMAGATRNHESAHPGPHAQSTQRRARPWPPDVVANLILEAAGMKHA